MLSHEIARTTGDAKEVAVNLQNALQSRFVGKSLSLQKLDGNWGYTLLEGNDEIVYVVADPENSALVVYASSISPAWLTEHHIQEALQRTG